MNRDSFILGLVLGMLVPLVGVFFYYCLKYLPSNYNLNDFIFLMKSNHQNIPRVLSLGMIACIPLITYYKNRHRYETLKGVFVFIIVYVLLAVLYKFNAF